MRADARSIPLADGTVQCIITSPPYWGLRDYGLATWLGGDPMCEHKSNGRYYTERTAAGASAEAFSESGEANAERLKRGRWREDGTCVHCGAIYDRGGIGLEPTLDGYIENMRAVGKELWRVLRDDGVFWLNLGDAYAGSGGAHTNGTNPGLSKSFYRDGAARTPNSKKQRTNAGSLAASQTEVPGGLKSKDLIGLPWRVAFALQADGWYLRSDIIWCLSGGTMLYARTQTGEGPAMLKDLVRLKPGTVELWSGEKWMRVVSWRRRGNRDGATELVLRSGERIGCTGEHRWPMSRDGQRATMPTDHLVVGDVLEMAHLPEPPGNGPRWLIDDAYWFAGLYLAEGSRSGDTIQISGHAKETQRWERVRIVCEHYGALPRLYIRGNKQAIHIDRAAALNAVLAFLLRGRTAKDKALSPNVWELPNKGLRLMVLGYLEGDGHLDGDRWRLGFTRNYRLEADLRCAAARLGASLTLKPSMVGRYPSFRGEWRWQNQEAKKDRGEIVEMRKSRAREFWDVSVADDPHLFALASGVLTHNSKPNPMPESVRDRPTRSHEYLFLLTKRSKYYYDAEAVREDGRKYTRIIGRNDDKVFGGNGHAEDHKPNRVGRVIETDGRNRRTVWQIPTQPYRGAHFATFPEKLVEPCILAGTSPKACGVCGAPWDRVVERTYPPTERRPAPNKGRTSAMGQRAANMTGDGFVPNRVAEVADLGWRPTCSHNDDTGSCLVLDPFCGSGTVGAVSRRFGRRFVGLDLSAPYLKLAQERIGAETIGMGI